MRISLLLPHLADLSCQARICGGAGEPKRRYQMAASVAGAVLLLAACLGITSLAVAEECRVAEVLGGRIRAGERYCHCTAKDPLPPPPPPPAYTTLNRLFCCTTAAHCNAVGRLHQHLLPWKVHSRCRCLTQERQQHLP